MTPTGASQRLALRLDPVACEGVGMCALVASRLVELDSWGYPVIPQDLPRDQTAAARAAVRACPRSALYLG
jgi:ferredoxin